MTDHCTNCGEPADHTEGHHVDQQRGNNDPDNLTDRCRNCHHDGAHDNPRAVDHRSEEKYGPRSVRCSPARPSTGPF